MCSKIAGLRSGSPPSKRESRRLKSMRPLRVLGLRVSQRWQPAGQVKIAVVATLLAGQVATMSKVILKSGQAETLHRRPP